MNIMEAWEAGYTGANIVVSILDDGIEKDHPDIAPNYDPLASKDINDKDDDPSPRYDSMDSNRHGTRCAGQVAAVGNNNICTVGVAFKAKIGGVRMLDGGITDAVEAESLSLNPQHIDIYSASWGPDDTGAALDGPGTAAKEAFVQGILKGRNGRGNIFVWASGNGGNADDSCACDGYANSIFTLSISSTSENGYKPWYLEECASTIATTYSSGDPRRERKVVTTDLHHKCTESHTGTSASAPMAAGIVALALEANPQLTWRDVQHIIVETSRPEPLNDANWIINGIGKKVSTRYGYGLMDGLALVKKAQNWKTAPEQRICSPHLDEKAKDIVGNTPLVLETTVNACSGTDDNIKYLEHVQAQISLEYSRRGDLTIYLTSPSGTRSQLIPRRSHDRSRGSYKEWPFMSVHFWGEDPVGTWKLEIMNSGERQGTGVFTMWRLVLYGTVEAPESSTLKRKGVSIDGQRLPVSGGILLKKQSNVTCHPECDIEAGCTGPSATDCNKCKHYQMTSGVCVSNCLPQFYRDDTNKRCVACTAHCSSCVSETHCLSCERNMFLSPNRSQCLVTCPVGFCQDDSTKSCEKCPGRCPPGFYDKWMWGCAPCHETCAVCTAGDETNCVKCRPGLSLDAKTRKCIPPISKCSFNEFEFNHKCTRCDIKCRTCTGGTEQDCVTCPEEKYFYNGTCVTECPRHHAPIEKKDSNNFIHRQCIYCFEEGVNLAGDCKQSDNDEVDLVNNLYGVYAPSSLKSVVTIISALTVFLIFLITCYICKHKVGL